MDKLLNTNPLLDSQKEPTTLDIHHLEPFHGRPSPQDIMKETQMKKNYLYVKEHRGRELQIKTLCGMKSPINLRN